jgi:hypothetical protein
MYKVMFNKTHRGSFANREDADNFVDRLCDDAERGDEITVIGPDDKPIYGFDKEGDYWG